MELKLLLLVILNVSTAVAVGEVGHVSVIRVTLHVFSGTPDPEWFIPKSSNNYEKILNGVDGQRSTKLGSQLGYNGFTIQFYKGGLFNRSVDVGKCTRPKFETLLLNIVKDLVPEGSTTGLGDPVVQYVLDQIKSCLK